jgi:hypothetical protein
MKIWCSINNIDKDSVELKIRVAREKMKTAFRTMMPVSLCWAWINNVPTVSPAKICHQKKGSMIARCSKLLSFTHTMMILLYPQIPLWFGKKPPDAAAASWQVTATGKLWLLCEEIEQILLTHRIIVPQINS